MTARPWRRKHGGTVIRRCPSCGERYELQAGANRDGNVLCPGCGGVLMARRKSLAERMIAQARQPAADATDAAARREHDPKLDPVDVDLPVEREP